MTRTLTQLLATAVAAVALTTLPSLMPAADTHGGAGAGAGTADQGKNLVGVDESTGKDVRAMLSRLIDDALNRDGLDDLVGYLSKADRDRLGKVDDMKVDDLNAKVDQFRKEFRDKYNQDFDLKPEHLKNLGVYQGSDKNHVLVKANLLAQDMKGDMKGDTGRRDEPRDTGRDAGKDLKDAGKDIKDAAKGMGDTIGGMAGTGTGRGAMLHLVNEGTVMNAWRVELPSTMTGQQLKDSLLRHVTQLSDSKGKWPDDVNKAYHSAAQHVLEALTTSPIASEK